MIIAWTVKEKIISDSSSKRQHIWQVRCSMGTLSNFPVTAANLHEADLIFAIATLFSKFLM